MTVAKVKVKGANTRSSTKLAAAKVGDWVSVNSTVQFGTQSWEEMGKKRPFSSRTDKRYRRFDNGDLVFSSYSRVQAIQHGRMVQRMTNTLDEAISGKECKMCMDTPRDCVLLPCHHMGLCKPCGDHIKASSAKCPFCRAPVEDIMEVIVC